MSKSRPKLFKSLPDGEKMETAILVRLLKSDAEAIRNAASIRQLSVSEFIRRAALGRRADVNAEVEVVLALLKLDRTINGIAKLHQAMIERGITPPVDDWRPVKNEIRQAVVRIAQRQSYDFSL